MILSTPGFERGQNLAREPDKDIRYCNPECNQQAKAGEMGRYRQSREISGIGRHDTRRYGRFWVQVL